MIFRMKKILFTLWCLGGTYLFAQKVEKIKYDQLEQKLSIPSDDTLTVINYWATWCRPCVKELPYFEQIHQEYSGSKKIRIWLVSVDFSDDYNKKLIPFVKNKQLACPILFLDESNPNSWISKVDENWSGAIPATVLYNSSGEKLEFHAGEFDYEGLKSFIDKHLKP